MRGSAAIATIDALPGDHPERVFRMAPPGVPPDSGMPYGRGFIDYGSGRRDAAGGSGGQASLVEKGNPSYHYMLGNALRTEGRMAEAVAQYERALLLEPDYAEAHNNLGAILDGQGRRGEAVAHYERALGIRPGYADAHCNLGLALAAEGRLPEAVLRYERALELNPRHLNAHNNLGLALAAQGRLAEAIEHFERVIALNPSHGSAHYSLGTVLMAQGRIAEATVHYERALQLSPGHADLHNNLGVALAEQGRTAEATVHYERALVLSPGYAAAHGNLGTALGEQGRTGEAAAHLERAIELDPGQADAHNSLGNLYKDEGRFEDAMAHYARAIAIRPDHGEAYLNRSEIKRFLPGDAELAALEALVRRNDLSATKAIHIHFALAKALEDTREYGRSFAHLRTGNALKRGQIRYDETRALGMLRRIAAVFDGSLLDRLRGAGDPSQVPVFVLGMPRSGSTLIEQILASHPQVHGAGELPGFEAAASGVFNTGAGYPECVSALDGVTLRRLGQAYLAGLPAIGDGKLRIVDKLPGNFLNIGLIRLFLPNARIVHTMRRPVDTCLSCYSKLFTSGHRYTYDLAELGRFYRGYRELMAHWRAALPPGAMLEVAYEDVVGDLEGQARRLIDYCGLRWDDRCLRFHETRRPVRTASAIQVRQPLFRSSLERWRKYETEIAPLLDELAIGSAPGESGRAAVCRTCSTDRG
jgi:tetratricopeptide (TPR) repeat protein